MASNKKFELDPGFEEVSNVELDPGFEEVSAGSQRAPTLKESFEDTVIDQLPELGAFGGGMIGGATGNIPGALAGAGAGGYAGKALQNVYNSAFRPERAPKDMVENLAGPVLSGVSGVGNELIGQGIGSLASRATGGLSGKVSAYLKELAERKAAKALGAERGTIKKIGSDRVQQIGRQALDQKVVTPFAGTDDLIDRNEGLMKRVMGERQAIYDRIDQANAGQFNPDQVADLIEKEIGGFNRESPLNSAMNKQIENTLDAIRLRGKNNISMKEAQALVEELRTAAKWPGIGMRSPKEELAQSAYQIGRRGLNDSAEKSAQLLGEEGLKKQIQDSNRIYSVGKDAEKLLRNKFAREQGNKLVGLTDTITGAGALGALGAPQTLGLMAAKRGAERYGNQIASTVFDKISKQLLLAPEVFGPYARPLVEAAKRGPQALAITQSLLNKDPEFRKIMQQLDKDSLKEEEIQE